MSDKRLTILVDMDDTIEHYEFCNDVKPRDDALDVLPRLKEKHDLYLVTNTIWANIQNKFKYCLFKHFDNIFDAKHIITCYKKQMIRGDVLIDDNPENLINGDYTGILIDAIHNQNFNCDCENIVRAKDWYEVEQIIKELV